MHEKILYLVIAYSIASFFIIIGILTIAVTFFSKALEKKGIGIPDRMKNVLFAKLILKVIAVGFLIFYSGPPIPPTSGNTTIPGHMNHEVYQIYNSAFDQFRKGNYQAAIDLFVRAIGKDPKNYILYANRSVVYLQNHKTTEAIEDLNIAMDLYAELSDQQKRRERMYRLLIVNQLIAAYVSTNEYEKACSIYENESHMLDDTSDSIMRIYNNIGNAFYEDHKWTEASTAYEKTFNLAKSLDNSEMQIRSSINLSNSKYWINGQELRALSSAGHAIELLDTYDLGIEKEAELRASSFNSIGLAKSICTEKRLQNYSIDLIIDDYSKGIELLKPFSDRSETEYLTLSNLYANRANSYRELEKYELSLNDYTTACNRFINRRYENGISRQLVGIYKILRTKEPLPKNELYALIYFANKIGSNKPPKQKEEDQQLLAEIESKLKNH